VTRRLDFVVLDPNVKKAFTRSGEADAWEGVDEDLERACVKSGLS